MEESMRYRVQHVFMGMRNPPEETEAINPKQAAAIVREWIIHRGSDVSVGDIMEVTPVAGGPTTRLRHMGRSEWEEAD